MLTLQESTQGLVLRRLKHVTVEQRRSTWTTHNHQITFLIRPATWASNLTIRSRLSRTIIQIRLVKKLKKDNGLDLELTQYWVIISKPQYLFYKVQRVSLHQLPMAQQALPRSSYSTQQVENLLLISLTRELRGFRATEVVLAILWRKSQSQKQLKLPLKTTTYAWLKTQWTMLTMVMSAV